MDINKDAFSNGQIDSKLWLCQELEKTGWNSKITHVYGGWYGMTSFLLLSRKNFKVNAIRSFDIDATCQPIADMINENWVIKNWTFKAFTLDCNQYQGPFADLVINTSTEHFNNISWFKNLPLGTRVVLQGNNMPHKDHICNFESLDSFINSYKLSKMVYSGQLNFKYPEWQFSRYMILGIR